MANKKVLHGWDMTLNQIANVILQFIAGSPGTPTEGQIWYDSTAHRFMYRDNAADIDVRSRAVHTGTQLAATISDFMATVVTARLDQFALPTGSVSMNGQKLTNVGAPVGGTDAARLVDLQNAIQGLSPKDGVRAATTAAGTLATSFANGSVIDGVTLATGDDILIKNQAAAAENGIYTVNAAGAPTRRADADVGAELLGAFVPVVEGTTNGNTIWMMTTDGPITLGTTALSWTQFGAGTLPVAGGGLTLTGNQLDIGAANGIIVNADTIQVDPAVVARKYSADVGDGSTTSIVVTHNLNTVDVHVTIYDKTTPFQEVDVDVRHTSVNTITLLFTTAPTAAQYRCVVFG